MPPYRSSSNASSSSTPESPTPVISPAPASPQVVWSCCAPPGRGTHPWAASRRASPWLAQTHRWAAENLGCNPLCILGRKPAQSAQDDSRDKYKYKYSIHTGISSRVSMMNPQWNETDGDETQRFHEAMTMVENELLGMVRHLAKVWYPARDLVRKALVERYTVDPSGAIFSLESHPCPWSNHILELECLDSGEDGSPLPEFTDADLKEFKGRALFCLYQRKDTNWSVQAIPRSNLEKFSKRLPFPEPWCGLRDAHLSEVTGISECVFVHASGFLAINRTREGALQLARVAMRLAKVIV